MSIEDSTAAVPGRDTGHEDAPTTPDPEAPAHGDQIDPDADPEMLNPRAPVEQDGERVQDPDADPGEVWPRD